MQTETEVDDLISFYKDIYRKKFAINTDEIIDKKLVENIFNKINSNIEDSQTTYELLKKAIVWYLYQHNNTNQAGITFPYQFRILLEQFWLLRICIEASSPLPLDILLIAQETGLTGKELTRAIKHGDIAGIEVEENIPRMLDEALIEAELFMNNLTPEGRKLFKKHPKMKELFTSQIPTAQCIRKATSFMAKLKDANE